MMPSSQVVGYDIEAGRNDDGNHGHLLADSIPTTPTESTSHGNSFSRNGMGETTMPQLSSSHSKEQQHPQQRQEVQYNGTRTNRMGYQTTPKENTPTKMRLNRNIIANQGVRVEDNHIDSKDDNDYEYNDFSTRLKDDNDDLEESFSDMSHQSLAPTDRTPDPSQTIAAVKNGGAESMGNDTNTFTSPSDELSKHDPNSFFAVEKARRCFWILWIVGYLSISLSCWGFLKSNRSTTGNQMNAEIIVILAMSVFTTIVGISFLYFNRMVRRREWILVREAEKTRNVVSSLFPPQFHDRLFGYASSTDGHNNGFNDIQENDDEEEKKESEAFDRMVRRVSSQFEIPLEAGDFDSLSEMRSISDQKNNRSYSSSGSSSSSMLQDEGSKAETESIPGLPPMPSLEESPMKSSNHSNSLDSFTKNDTGMKEGRGRQRGSMDMTSSSDITPRRGLGLTRLPSLKNTSLRNLMGFAPEQSGANKNSNWDANGTPMTPMTPRRPNFADLLKSKTTSLRNIRSLSTGSTLLGDSHGINKSERSNDSTLLYSDEPIADLFPNCTVLFADISGFTAWSSAREPTQVFKLLETIYRCFDGIARKRNVFKVETIGDCYLAVTGLPEPQKDHAMIMVLFAKKCMSQMREVTRQLETVLGPETASLAMRFGLHSGPVTAGVLRGEKSRFQLFGDTVNMASRMESTGERNRIQVSQATADLLVIAGKQHWIQPRDGLVDAKGKGQVQTYWISPKSYASSDEGSVTSLNDSLGSFVDPDAEPQLKSRAKKSSSLHNYSSHKSPISSVKHLSGHKSPRSRSNTPLNDSRRAMLNNAHHAANIWASRRSDDHDDPIAEDEDEDDDPDYDGFADIEKDEQERLIDWNINILSELLKRILSARFIASPSRIRKGRRPPVFENEPTSEGEKRRNPFDEITEIISIGPQHNEVKRTTIDPKTVKLSNNVEDQLRQYVTTIAFMYRENFFHNFEHASHVLMSAQKLLGRVIVTSEIEEDSGKFDSFSSVIARDPLACFAIVFSALIHDVDHTGVPNGQLIKEKAHIADLYNNRSIAEQNSLDLCWNLLLSDEYKDLQNAIFSNQTELQRFRQLVVNVILATDIFDKDMIQVRNTRWEKAFGTLSEEIDMSDDDKKSLKATIVIEYIMQASDVSHTMQHWQVYQKWNARLFEEMYTAYQTNRADKDPSIGWYQGELWFFDNYIIPLAKKLKECQVFGSASDQFLNYALENRNEWEAKGEAIVEWLVKQHSQSL